MNEPEDLRYVAVRLVADKQNATLVLGECYQYERTRADRYEKALRDIAHEDEHGHRASAKVMQAIALRALDNDGGEEMSTDLPRPVTPPRWAYDLDNGMLIIEAVGDLTEADALAVIALWDWIARCDHYRQIANGESMRADMYQERCDQLERERDEARDAAVTRATNEF
jgi:hypothetical protein